MQKIPFVKLSPTQNVTVLVTQSVPRSEQAAMSAKLLAYDGVGGEQVGFLEPAVIPGAQVRLQMMGGEFCGNATMSVGAYLAEREGLADGESRDYVLEISGANGPTHCLIERTGDAWRGKVRMPCPECVREYELETECGLRQVPVVVFPGISHLIVPANEAWSRETIEKCIRSWNDVIGADALGVLRYDEEKMTIEPAVYVPATDSVVWERGCGSGTAAIGCRNAVKYGAFEGEIRQPGGTIYVAAKAEDGRISDLSIAGTVRIVAEGTAFI